MSAATTKKRPERGGEKENTLIIYACIKYLAEKSYSVTKHSNIKYKNDNPYVVFASKKYYVQIMKIG